MPIQLYVYAESPKYWDGYGTGYHEVEVIVIQLNCFVKVHEMHLK